jgi:hypothetical protein
MEPGFGPRAVDDGRLEENLKRRMATRILLGLLKGVVVGGAIGALVVFGLSMSVFPAWLAYIAAVVVGALTGLVAGKPIWAKDARIEAGLKAAAGAIIAGLAMFAVRKWLTVNLDLGALGKGLVGDLPIASLPLISAVLALLFEADNTGDDGAKDEKRSAPKTRVAEIDAGAGDEAEEDSDVEESASSNKAQRH